MKFWIQLSSAIIRNNIIFAKVYKKNTMVTNAKYSVGRGACTV